MPLSPAALWALVVALTVGAEASCSAVPWVDRHVLRNGMDVALRPVVGWTLSPACGNASQAGFRVELSKASGGPPVFTSDQVSTNRSVAVPFAVWAKGSGISALAPGTSYRLRVAVELAGTSQGDPDWSDAVDFRTQLSAGALSSSMPIWAAPASAGGPSALFALLRRSVPRPAPGAQTFLAVTAKPSPDWNLPHGRNTSHLLCAYKLWVNGVSLGVGPGRRVGGAVPVDTFNITALVSARDENAVAIEAYYRPAHNNDATARALSRDPPADPDDHGGVVALFHDADGNEVSGALSGWLALDATAAFGPNFGPSGNGAGTGSYAQPHENIDMRAYPQGWRTAPVGELGAGGWSPAVGRTPLADGLAAKEALPVTLRSVPAASFEVLSESVDAATGAPSFWYVVDFGRNMQGHVNISFGSSRPGQQVSVRLGEERIANGSVKYHMESNNVYIDQWSLTGRAMTDSFVPHEYCEFRWAEVVGAPEPPTHERVAGWQVHYPFDGDLNEGDGSATSLALTLRDVSASQGNGMAPGRVGGATPHAPTPGLTAFASSVSELNQVWALVEHTVNAASLDLNTDSNTRQRDVCTLDAFLTTRYQGGVAPATAAHLRRRVTQNMWEANGYVNCWTEFLVAHIGALAEYTTEYAASGEGDLVSRLWGSQPIDVGAKGPGLLGANNYSLLAYFNESDDLVHRTPKPLIDWPRSEIIDTNGRTSTLCNNLCVQMNAYAVLTQEWMAELATRVGSKNAQAYGNRSAAIRAAAHASFSATGNHCVVDPGPGPGPPPPPSPPPPPVPKTVSTCALVWEKDTRAHHHNSNGVATLNCRPGQKVSRVVFADFGLANGSCTSGFTVNRQCHSAANHPAKTIVETICLGHQYCFLDASDATFGDACTGTCKRLAVQVECAPAKSDDAAARDAAFDHGAAPFNCYADNPVVSSSGGATTATASSLAALARLPGTAAGVLDLVPFLRARQGRRGSAHGLETSGWMTGFMLEAILAAASETGEGSLPVSAVADAADLCHETLVNAGSNSWLGMIAQNATMTMESWPGGGGGTFSHPWTSAPARVIPRFLMGVRPLSDGWERLAIRPLPGRALTSASLETLTPRGTVKLSFEVDSSAVTASVTVPGNTLAHVCLPRYALGGKENGCKLTINAESVACVDAGGLTCLPSELGGGEYQLKLTC